MNIYDELRSGRTAEEIAAAFTEQLNSAEARVRQEREEAEAKELAAREAAEARAVHQAQKREEMIDVIEAGFRYLSKHYPTIGITDEEWDREDLSAIAELAVLMLDIEVAKATRATRQELPRKVKAKSPEAVKSADEVFSDFFKQFGLLS